MSFCSPAIWTMAEMWPLTFLTGEQTKTGLFGSPTLNIEIVAQARPRGQGRSRWVELVSVRLMSLKSYAGLQDDRNPASPIRYTTTVPRFLLKKRPLRISIINSTSRAPSQFLTFAKPGQEVRPGDWMCPSCGDDVR